MKRVIYLIMMFMLVHTSCQQRLDDGIGSVLDVNLSFLLSDYSGEEISTLRTRAEELVKIEARVSDVWLLQFEVGADNETKLLRRRYISRVTSSTGGEGGIFAAALTANVEQELYIIANTGDDKLYEQIHPDGKESPPDGKKMAQFKRKQIEYKRSKIGVLSSVPKVGVLKGFIESVDAQGLIKLRGVEISKKIDLFHLFAKVVFNYSVADSFKEELGAKKWFKVTNVTLRNFPNLATTFPAIFENGVPASIDSTYVWPTSSTAMDSTFVIENASEYKGQCTFYMPELIGGITDYVTHVSEKIGHRVDDVLSGGVEISKPLSYIDMEGDYYTTLTDSNGDDLPTTYEVSYRIYLGENNLNNYNVRANYIYSQSVLNISTIYEGDDRITLTKKTL